MNPTEFVLKRFVSAEFVFLLFGIDPGGRSAAVAAKAAASIKMTDLVFINYPFHCHINSNADACSSFRLLLLLCSSHPDSLPMHYRDQLPQIIVTHASEDKVARGIRLQKVRTMSPSDGGSQSHTTETILTPEMEL